MAKLTRKSYKRKKIAFAAVLLGGVGLVSSGFAAWVLSAQANSNATGNVKVGTVKNGALKINVYKNSDFATDEIVNDGSADSFSFNADSKDVNSGNTNKNNHVYWEEKEGEEAEKMELTFYVKITSKVDSFANLVVNFAVTDSKGSNPSNYKKAVEEGYVVLPDCAKENGTTITLDDTGKKFKSDLVSESSNDKLLESSTVEHTNESDDFVYKIAYTVKFGWGERYNKVNPCYFFDGESIGNESFKNGGNVLKGKEVPMDDVDKDLTALHSYLDGASYKITFTATGK